MPSNVPAFVFFAGKGGVGKTTCAAAWAIAEAQAGRRVLAVSTDPAHSLGDALGARLSARPSPVRAGGRTFQAVELNGPRAFERWLRDHRQALGEVLEHGTWLDRADIDALLELSIPGIDELVAMLEIVRLSKAAYDLVIVDTAPTGHALRLIAAPDTVVAVAEALDALQREHRLIRQQLARVGRPEAADRLIALLAEQAHRTGALLRDPDRAAFHWVLLPEALSVAESEDGLRALGRARINVSDVIVNRVLPDGPPCPICHRRREYEHAIVRNVARSLGRGRAVQVVHAEPHEPRSRAALARIGAGLRSRTEAVVARRKGRPARRSSPTASEGGPTSASTVLSLTEDAHTISPHAIPGCRGAKLLLFAGKGGVGKTTAAAATALFLARAQTSRRVLLMSMDPAHSLGDVFRAAIGDRPIVLPGGPKNLHVRELDAAEALASRRTHLRAALHEIADAFGAHPLTTAGGHGIKELMDLAPPGIDELFGILSVAGLLAPAKEEYDLLVIDTAPTGHALRLLEMPDAAHDWVQLLLRVLLKYRQVVRPAQLAVELVELSKSIHAVQDLLHNAADTRFIVVTRAARVPRLETERFIRRLRRMRLAAPAVVVNAMTLAPRRCSWCRATAREERRELITLSRACRRSLRECAIILTPLAEPPPRGIAPLERWARAWILDESRRAR